MNQPVVRRAMAMLGLCSAPLITLSSCDFGPAGGTFVLDRFDDEGYYYYDVPYRYNCCYTEEVIVVEETYYYDDYYWWEDPYSGYLFW